MIDVGHGCDSWLQREKSKGYERLLLTVVSEDHNEAYYSVEDQRFLGEEGFGEDISRAVGETARGKEKPIEADLKEIAGQLKTNVELLRGKTGGRDAVSLIE